MGRRPMVEASEKHRVLNQTWEGRGIYFIALHPWDTYRGYVHIGVRASMYELGGEGGHIQSIPEDLRENYSLPQIPGSFF